MNRPSAKTALSLLMFQFLRSKPNIDQFVSAAERGDYNLVSSLLSQGINIDGNSNGHTALIRASYNGHERVVSLLIERGANIDIQTNVRIL